MTPHIKALKGEIADTVLMPGDPKRAKFIAENYLENYKVVSDVRGILAYTGYYKNKKITIMASGMGNASMGIYSYELYKFYDVENIIRIGSCGAYSPNLNVYDVLLVNSCYSESTYGYVQNGDTNNILYSDSELNDKILNLGYNIIVGRVHSCDAFYNNLDIKELYEKYECLAVEMESFALFHNAKALNKKATCLLTVSDSLVTGASLDSDARERSFKEMIEIALKSVL